MNDKRKSDTPSNKSQSASFVDAARQLGCDEDPAHFDEILKKVARHKPPPTNTPQEQKKPKKRG